jgi:signal transduction histidine kinase/HPt (histidine-containing phosphotransfer) domain-containing protein/ActR/RegA family two-component response regulator
MTLFRSSILVRLMLFIGAFVVIIVGSAAASAVALRAVELDTEEITQRWLVGSTLLGEIDSLVATFRIAELSHALGPDQKRRAAADVIADTAKRTIADLENQYVTLLGDKLPRGALDSFREAWKNYQAGHDAWVKADVNGATDGPVYDDSALGRRYRATDTAIEHLVNLQRDIARARADAVDQIGDQMTVVAGAIAAAATLLAISLMFGIRNQITRPLVEETQILAKIRHGENLTHFETTRRRKNGELVPVSVTISPIKDAAGTVIGASKIARDISDQKKTERSLKQAKEDAEAGARIKAAFVANMSHEIRTPMNAILGFAEVVLQDTQLPPQSAQHVRIILSSAKALLTIINDILDVSKLESGKLELETVAFHLPNALAEALRVLDQSASDKGLKLVMEYDAELPLRFKGDPARLRQVVLNLVGNSIKFTEKGWVTLSVRPWKQANMLHFAITDTGIGMTPEQSAKVFKPFSQADASTTRRFGGTGLGTTISKQIVELMGGEIWVESELRKGSTFHFTIHLPEASAHDDCLYETDRAVVGGYVSPRAFHVLLVEDIEVNATLAMLRLEEQGHLVEWRKNGREAVDAFQTGRYDLILMDVMMPEMDGLEATREIRKLEKPGEHTPIIALTASAMREDYDLCIVAGMDSVQAKPIDFSGLLSAMEQVVPEGQGQPIAVSRIEIVAPIGVDFSPLDGIVDHQNALKTWRDPVVYAKALASFAADRSRDADEIERLLLASPGNAEPARAVAHTLKGVAGNLFITKVAGLATKIDADLKSQHRKAAISELGQLRWLLAEAANAIGKIVPCDDDAAAQAKVFDPAAAVALLKDLSSALEKLNPYAAEPILARLAEYLQKTDLAPIQPRVDAFDFMGAKARAAALAEVLGVNGG